MISVSSFQAARKTTSDNRNAPYKNTESGQLKSVYSTVLNDHLTTFKGHSRKMEAEEVPTSNFTEVPNPPSVPEQTIILTRPTAVGGRPTKVHWMSYQSRIACCFLKGRLFMVLTVLGFLLSLLSIPCFMVEGPVKGSERVGELLIIAYILIGLGMLFALTGLVGIGYFTWTVSSLATEDQSVLYLVSSDKLEETQERFSSVETELKTTGFSYNEDGIAIGS